MKLPYTGLSEQEVTERRRAGLDNVTKARVSKSTVKIITGNIFTYFNLIFFVISILLIIAGSFRNLTFLGPIIANIFIGIFQELHAKKVLDKLQVVNTPIARVIRSGTLKKLPITDLVLDDIIMLKAGDQIPADAELLSGEVSVNEALLTGEADEIMKTTGSELMSGSFVVHGECFAKLTRVGDSSYAAELTIKAKAIKPGEQSEIMRGLNKFVRFAGLAIIPVGIIMMAQQLIKGATYATATEAMVAAIIGMIPEGLFLLSSVTLMLSAVRLAEQQVLLHDMKSIETLARVDTLCVDKTGTITSGKMKVKDSLWLQPEADYLAPLAATVKALSADSETMVALKSAYKKVLSAQQSSDTTPVNPKIVQGFSSRLKYSGVTFENGDTYVLGAPELVLRNDFAKIQSQIEAYNQQGFRTLVFAKYNGELRDQPLEKKATALAIIILEDEIRPAATETFRYFAEQGVEIKVISGDSPVTVSAVAARAGIAHAESYIDLSVHLSDKEIEKAARTYTIFGRVTPADKRRLVKALQKAGRTVAMTGDGVNDVLALKDADCSVAMASGASAAAQAAQVVLLESDFSKMPAVVMEGRRVVNNLERSGSLFIVKNLFSLSAALLTMLAGIAYPMIPAQVSLISFWAIGVPSFLLAQIPNQKLIRGNFIKNILAAAAPTAITALLLVSSAVILSHITDVDPRFLGTICVAVWAAVSLTHLFRIARPYDHLSLGICAFCLAGVVTSFFAAAGFFGIEHGLSFREWAIIIGLGLLAAPTITLIRKVTKDVYGILHHRTLK